MAAIVVSPPDHLFEPEPEVGGSVWERGNWVSWIRVDYVDYVDYVDRDDTTNVGGYRNVTDNAAPVTDDDIGGLAATGVIDFVPNELDTYVLRLFDGGTVSLPQTTAGGAERLSYTYPQVEGHTVAWLDPTQALLVAPLAIHPAPPRMDGDTLAPKPELPNVKWHPYVPYSEPLTSCSATVTSGTHVVATLACNNAYLTKGVADLVWDEMTGSRHDPAGTYHYTITAAGDGGAALDSAGTTTPVAGHFTIN